MPPSQNNSTGSASVVRLGVAEVGFYAVRVRWIPIRILSCLTPVIHLVLRLRRGQSRVKQQLEWVTQSPPSRTVMPQHKRRIV